MRTIIKYNRSIALNQMSDQGEISGSNRAEFEGLKLGNFR